MIRKADHKQRIPGKKFLGCCSLPLDFGGRSSLTSSHSENTDSHRLHDPSGKISGTSPSCQTLRRSPSCPLFRRSSQKERIPRQTPRRHALISQSLRWHYPNQVRSKINLPLSLSHRLPRLSSHCYLFYFKKFESFKTFFVLLSYFSLPSISYLIKSVNCYCSRIAQTATDFADGSHSKSAKSATTTVSYGIFSSENAYPCTVTKNSLPAFIKCQRGSLFVKFATRKLRNIKLNSNSSYSSQLW